MAPVQRGSVNRFTVFGKAAVSVLLIVWVLGAAFLSSGRHLHGEIHHDSGDAAHHCAITLFERGQTLNCDPICVIVVQPGTRTETSVTSQAEHFSSVRILTNATRGPPV